MKNYRGSAEGLRIIFKAVIWMLICTFFSVMPLVLIIGLAITSLVLYLKFLLNSAEQLGASV